MQKESYKSTVSHELRTPLNSSSIIMTRIIQILDTNQALELCKIKELKTKGTMVLAQLQFMECFVEDLLSLNLIQNKRLKS